MWFSPGPTGSRSQRNRPRLSSCSQETASHGRIRDCYTCATGQTATLGNFAKATFAAIAATYAYLTPDMWSPTVFTNSPHQEYTDYLAKPFVKQPKKEVKY